MGNFDFSPPVLPNLGESLAPIGDALTEVMRRRQQRQQFEQQLAVQKEAEDRKREMMQNQFDIQNRAAARLEARDAETQEMERSKYRETQRGKVTAALGAGNPQEATAIAAGTYIGMDQNGRPQYGSLTPGQMRDVGPEPVAPQPQDRPKPAPVPVPAQVVPPEIAALRARRLPTLSLTEPTMTPKEAPLALGTKAPIPEEYIPEITRGLPLGVDPALRVQRDALRDIVREQRAGAETEQARAAEDLASYPARQAEAEADIRRFDAKVAGFRGEHDRYLADKRLAESEVPYTLNLGGTPVPVDVQTQRYLSRSRNADDFRQALPPNLTEPERQAAAHALEAIQSGLPLKDAFAMYGRERISGATLTSKESEGAANRENRIDVARINATRPMVSLGMQERRFEAGQDKDRRRETRGDIEKWLTSTGLEKAGANLAVMNQTISQLRGNPREQQAALVGMARSVQGDNRFSDTDYRVFVQNGGVGALDSAANTIQKIIDGGFGSESLRVSQKMAQALRAVFQNRLVEGGQAAKENFVHNEIYDPAVAESVLEQRLAGFYKRDSERGEGAKGVPGRLGGGGSGGGAVKIQGGPDNTVDELLEMAKGKKRRVIP